MDPKQLLLRHGEKLALGACALIAALLSASGLLLSTGIVVEPEEIERARKRAEERIRVNPPEELVVRDWSARLEKLREPLPGHPYDNLWWQDEHIRFAPRSRPKLLVPEDLICTPGGDMLIVYKRDSKGNIVYEELPVAEGPAEGGRGAPGAGPGPAVIVPPEVAAAGPGGAMPAGAGRGAAGEPGIEGLPFVPVKPKLEDMFVGDNKDAVLRDIQGARRGVAGELDEFARDLAPESEPKGVPVVQGEPRRWVVVTAAFPHLRQLEEFKRALKQDELVEYDRVQCQRRQLLSDGSWGPWADVTYEIDFYGFLPELEPYLPAIFIDTLVHPLPMLAFGVWAGAYRTDVFEAVRKARGLAERQRDAHLQQLAEGAGQAAALGRTTSRLGGRLRVTGGADDRKPTSARAKEEEKLRRVEEELDIQTRTTSIVEKVLIRFIDMTVESGRTYQYRMRVWFNNPNYKVRNVVSPRLATEEKITSEDNKETGEEAWSQPSKPVHVPEDVYYYAKGGTRNAAVLEIHSWAYGSWQVRTSTSEAVGRFVGEEKRPADVVTIYREIPTNPRYNVNFEAPYHLLLDVIPRQYTVTVSLGNRQDNTRLRDLCDMVFIRPDGKLQVRYNWLDEIDPARQRRTAAYESLKKEAEDRAKAQERATQVELGPRPMEGLPPPEPMEPGRRGTRRHRTGPEVR